MSIEVITALILTSSHRCMYLSNLDILNKRSRLNIFANLRILNALEAFSKEGETVAEPCVAISVK